MTVCAHPYAVIQKFWYRLPDIGRTGRGSAKQARQRTDDQHDLNERCHFRDQQGICVEMSTHRLHELGQRLWLDNITRELLDSGTLAHYIRDCSITGLTSNPSIFDAALSTSDAYDDEIAVRSAAGLAGESLFNHIALRDLGRAAELFRPLFVDSDGLDGWVSMEISPLLANDRDASIAAAREIHQLAKTPNLLVKIPGTTAGITAIEASICTGIPINVTLLFSKAQYLAVAEAYMRALEQRLRSGLDLRVESVASIFISRWDSATDSLPQVELRGQLGIAVGRDIYAAHRESLTTDRWRKLASSGARPQRLLWASTGNKNPESSPTYYVSALAAPDTIITLPEKTLLALDCPNSSGPIVNDTMPEDGKLARTTLAQFQDAGVDLDALALKLQSDGVQAFVKSWHSLLARIASKTELMHDAGQS